MYDLLAVKQNILMHFGELMLHKHYQHAGNNTIGAIAAYKIRYQACTSVSKC